MIQPANQETPSPRPQILKTTLLICFMKKWVQPPFPPVTASFYMH